MTCPACEGKRCEHCNHSGIIALTECPLRLVTADVWQLFRAIDWRDKGLLPVPGGWLDQTASFMRIADYAQNLDRRVKAALSK